MNKQEWSCVGPASRLRLINVASLEAQGVKHLPAMWETWV